MFLDGSRLSAGSREGLDLGLLRALGSSDGGSFAVLPGSPSSVLSKRVRGRPLQACPGGVRMSHILLPEGAPGRNQRTLVKGVCLHPSGTQRRLRRVHLGTDEVREGFSEEVIRAEECRLCVVVGGQNRLLPSPAPRGRSGDSQERKWGRMLKAEGIEACFVGSAMLRSRA